MSEQELTILIEDWLDSDSHSGTLPAKFMFSDIQKVAELLAPRIKELLTEV